jgi:hypothetical protein
MTPEERDTLKMAYGWLKALGCSLPFMAKLKTICDSPSDADGATHPWKHALEETVRIMGEKLEAAERDAARYRWIRSASVQSGIVLPERWWELLGDTLDEDFDKMLDQAIADNEHAAVYSSTTRAAEVK